MLLEFGLCWNWGKEVVAGGDSSPGEVAEE